MTLVALRAAVQFLIGHGRSDRRACSLVDLQRSTFQYQPRPARAAELVAQVQPLAQRQPRYGYRRVWALVRRRGQQVNKTRMPRRWKRSKLQVRKVRRNRPPPPTTGGPVQATPPGHVWTSDVVHAHLLNGTALKILTVLDAFTRAGLALEVATSLPSSRVSAVLGGLVAPYGAPALLRSDHGPEFIALALRGWLAQQHPETLYSDPGGRWPNGDGARVTGTVRADCLNMEVVHTVAAARVRLAASRQAYNEARPHSSLG